MIQSHLSRFVGVVAVVGGMSGLVACDAKTDCSKCPAATAPAQSATKPATKTASPTAAAPADATSATTKLEPAPTPAAKGQGVSLTAGGTTVTTVGAPPKKGVEAPSFRVARFVPGNRIPETATSSGTWKGKPLIVSIVPSLDTPVCETQTSMIQSKFADGKYQDKATLVTVSRDLPFAMARFAETHPGATLLYSDFKYRDLGQAWGLEVAETGLLARSVWVLDADGKVAYSEIVEDQGSEPQYDPIFAALDGVLKAP